MPSQPLWIERLPSIRKQVENAAAPVWWDRTAVEKLFCLRRRQAIALLHEMGAEWIGNNLAIERGVLRRFLAQPRRQNAHLEEQNRSTRVAAALGQARREQNARRIAIPLQGDPERLDFGGLPAGVDLQRQQLTISFETPAQLLEKLVALAQALMNDYDTFEAKLRPPESVA